MTIKWHHNSKISHIKSIFWVKKNCQNTKNRINLINTGDKTMYLYQATGLNLCLSIIVSQGWVCPRCLQHGSCVVRWRVDQGRRPCWPWIPSHMWPCQRWQDNHVVALHPHPLRQHQGIQMNMTNREWLDQSVLFWVDYCYSLSSAKKKSTTGGVLTWYEWWKCQKC